MCDSKLSLCLSHFRSSVNLQPGLITYTGFTSWGSKKCCGNIWPVPHVEQNKEPKPRHDKSDSFCVLSPVIGLHVPPFGSFTMICFSSIIFLLVPADPLCWFRDRSPVSQWILWTIHLTGDALVTLSWLKQMHQHQYSHNTPFLSSTAPPACWASWFDRLSLTGPLGNNWKHKECEAEAWLQNLSAFVSTYLMNLHRLEIRPDRQPALLIYEQTRKIEWRGGWKPE